MLKKTIPYITALFIVAVAIFLFVTLRRSFNDPRNVFNNMLESNLSSLGVTREVYQENAGQSLRQINQAQVGEENVVNGSTLLSQGEGQSETLIVTESIGTPTTDYIRYVDIQTQQTNQNGEPLDFSNVLGVWGESGAGGALTGGELFSEAVLGVVPFGRLDQAQRQEMLQYIKENNIYQTDFDGVERTIENGRPTYVYSVTLKPVDYVTMLKEYAQMIGLNQLDATDPSIYAQSPDLNLKLAVDVWSRQLRRISYEGDTREEGFGAYGLQRNIDIPEQTISIQELQSRLQNL